MFRACNTVKLSRAWSRRPWKYMDPTPRPVKIAQDRSRDDSTEAEAPYVTQQGDYAIIHDCSPEEDWFRFMGYTGRNEYNQGVLKC